MRSHRVRKMVLFLSFLVLAVLFTNIRGAPGYDIFTYRERTPNLCGEQGPIVFSGLSADNYNGFTSINWHDHYQTTMISGPNVYASAFFDASSWGPTQNSYLYVGGAFSNESSDEILIHSSNNFLKDPLKDNCLIEPTTWSRDLSRRSIYAAPPWMGNDPTVAVASWLDAGIMKPHQMFYFSQAMGDVAGKIYKIGWAVSDTSDGLIGSPVIQSTKIIL